MNATAAQTGRPRVLLVYYSYTQQTVKVVDAMSEVFTQKGCAVTAAPIEFTDSRYVDRFARFPMRHAFFDLLRMLPAQLRRATGEIRIPAQAKEEYDLICVGSPTWWLTTNIPIRSFLESADAARLLEGKKFAAMVPCRRYWRNNLKTVKRLGAKRGGRYVDGIHFTYAGGQIRSLLSLLSYLGSGDQRERYLGVRIPATNIQAAHLEAAREFADGLAEGLVRPLRSSADKQQGERKASAEKQG